MITLTRRYRFSASHRLHSPQLSPAENERLYGKCNHPFGHGHNYVLDVTVEGLPDEVTGLILPLAHLDRLVEDNVLQLFSFRYINKDVPQFAALVPTTENIALVVAQILQSQWATMQLDRPARLYGVHLQETDRNGFGILFKTPQSHESGQDRLERVLALK